MSAITLGKLRDMFIEDLAARVASRLSRPRTLEHYQYNLRVVDQLGAERDVVCLRSVEIQLKACTWHKMQAIKRLFTWAMKQTPPLISFSPAHFCQMPPLGERSRILTRQEGVRMRRRAYRTLRDVLTCLDQSLARPQEVRSLGWSMIREQGDAFVLRSYKGKDRRRQKLAVRVIPISRRLRRLLDRLRRRGVPGDVIFRNRQGNPFSAQQLRKGVRNLRRRLGLAGDEPVVAYTIRHTGGTRAILNNVHQIRVAAVMGHSSVTMTQRYVHLAAQDVVEVIEQATAPRRTPRG